MKVKILQALFKYIKDCIFWFFIKYKETKQAAVNISYQCIHVLTAEFTVSYFSSKHCIDFQDKTKPWLFSFNCQV